VTLSAFFSPVLPLTVTSPLSLHDALPICLDDLRMQLTGVAHHPVADAQGGAPARVERRQLGRGDPQLDARGLPDEPAGLDRVGRSEEHTSELQSRENLVCRLLLEKKKNRT